MSRYIDADKLVEYQEHAWDWDTVNGIETAIALRQVISDIRHEPTADVGEVKHGRWIDQVGEDEIPTQKCSVCGYLEYVYDRPNYCSNCGADMRSRLQGTEIDGIFIDISGDGTVIERI